MKTLELSKSNTPTLPELLALAEKEPVLLRTTSGQEYLVGIVDDFQHEIDHLNASAEFQEFLRERFKEDGATSVEEVRERLA